jgi:hypothetical protein
VVLRDDQETPASVLLKTITGLPRDATSKTLESEGSIAMSARETDPKSSGNQRSPPSAVLKTLELAMQ